METTRRKVLLAVNILLWTLVAVLLYARWIEPNRIRVETVRLPAGLERKTVGDLRIVHLADLHIASVGAHEERLVRTVNALAPDLVFVTGDLAQFYDGTAGARSVLDRFTPSLGTFAVLGDADYSNHTDHCLYCHATGPGTRRPDRGWRVLRNERVIVEKDGWRILIAGVDDPAGPCGGPGFSTVPPPEPADLAILLSSSPLVLPRAEEEHYDLVLAGDTHGGQVRIPFIGPVARHVEGSDYGFAGWVESGNTIMFINRGFGTSYLPYRLACPPLVAVLDWTSSSTGQ